MGKAELTIPLEIPDVRVLRSEINASGELIIIIESTKETAGCDRCGKTIGKFHGCASWVGCDICRYLDIRPACAITPSAIVVNIAMVSRQQPGIWIGTNQIRQTPLLTNSTYATGNLFRKHIEVG